MVKWMEVMWIRVFLRCALPLVHLGFLFFHLEIFLRGDFFAGAARVIMRMFRLDRVLVIWSNDDSS